MRPSLKMLGRLYRVEIRFSIAALCVAATMQLRGCELQHRPLKVTRL
jgi:hypothetical protein